MRSHRTRSPVLAALLTAAAALALPAAAAAERCHSQAEATTYEISLPGSHHYRVELESDEAGQVELSVEKPGRFALYAVQGEVRPHRLRARFGRLGQIALRIRHPKRDPLPAEPVVLEGTLAFRGEEGFTAVSLHRVKGAVFHRFSDACGSHTSKSAVSASGSTAQQPITFFGAAAKSPGRTVAVSLQATDPPDLGEDGGGDFVDALLQERRGGMKIERGVFIDGSATAGVGAPLGSDPLTGSVSAPLPFRGSAEYSRASASQASWSGDLTVSLPGAGNVPLTGPGFSALACSATALRSADGCREDVAELIEDSFLFPFLL